MPEASAQLAWAALTDELCSRHRDIGRGRMMSHEALTLNRKVFAFLASHGGAGGLGLRLGREFDRDTLPDRTPLAPFKTKPPMKDWVILTSPVRDTWVDWATKAYQIAKN